MRVLLLVASCSVFVLLITIFVIMISWLLGSYIFEVALVCVGGLFRHSGLMWGCFCERLVIAVLIVVTVVILFVCLYIVDSVDLRCFLFCVIIFVLGVVILLLGRDLYVKIIG